MPEYIIFVIFHSYVYLHPICVLVNLIAFYFGLVTCFFFECLSTSLPE